MSSPEWIWSFDQHIASDPDLCSSIVADLIAALQEHQWGEEDQFGIRMAIEESVMNAIRHGNKCDAAKPVHIVMRFSESKFYAKVTDQGGGFDPDCIADPTCEDNVAKPCGRGVMLMKNFVDSVKYNDAGNEVEMMKEKTGSLPRE